MPVVPPDTAVILNQKNKEFVPHVLPIVRGTTVVFFNHDDFLHNLHGYRQSKTVFNVAMPYVGMKWKKKFDEAGKVSILCDVHPEMSAYIIVLNTPYFTKTGKDGAFVIPHVPAGEYVLQTWHEKGKAKTLTITVSGSDTTAVNLQLGD
ncbi:MAG: hypothetical protein HY304_00505 [candidate division Zixibacteria bacterium]|nr:hypothetical protein [candidate division Zixibacteria bacterium]